MPLQLWGKLGIVVWVRGVKAYVEQTLKLGMNCGSLPLDMEREYIQEAKRPLRRAQVSSWMSHWVPTVAKETVVAPDR